MKQKTLKLVAVTTLSLMVSAAYACWVDDNPNLPCAKSGDTASLTLTCSNSSGLTWTVSQTASFQSGGLPQDVAYVPPSGTLGWSALRVETCPATWGYLDCQGTHHTINNLTTYGSPDLAQNCTQP